MTKRQHTTQDPAYRKARKQLLADHPPCHWCGKPNAETADHLVEVDRGGSHTDGLVPSCRPCNSKRGQRYKTQRDAQKQHARKEAMKDIGIPISKEKTQKTEKVSEFFYEKKILPPTQSISISETSLNQPELLGYPHDLPRLCTMVPDQSSLFASHLGIFAETYMGHTLMPWQQLALSGQLQENAAGDLLHRVSLVSTARQCGKSFALMALIGGWLTEMPKIRGERQTVLSTAHRLDLAVMLFDELSPILEKHFGAHVVRSYGRNQVIMPDGSRWLVRAANPSVGHGTSPDLVVADEIWDISREAIDGGLLPAQRARKNPLLSMWSTAGTEHSVAMLRWREQGLRQIDQRKQGNFFFAEWSPPPDLNPMTPEAWAYGNPALGHTLSIETLIAESENPDRAQFLRASCNLWVASDKGWLQPGLWPALLYEGPIPEGGTVAIETSMDDTRYFAVRCVQLPDRRTLATVEFMADTLAECLTRCTELAKNPNIKFAITPTIDIHWPLLLERRKVTWGYGEILKFTPAVKNMITEKLLVHTGEMMLAEHVQRAVAVRQQSSIALSSQRSPGPIELARCMVAAAALASSGARSTQGKPMIMVANR